MKSDVYLELDIGSQYSKITEYNKHKYKICSTEILKSVSLLIFLIINKQIVNTIGTIKKSFT